ncbi:sodium:solute symporter family protein [Amycolatopsis jejuensis]|uniref:sodium:solute symporter family protein n=1 Tax=Amycolatopsis jejuensis TaxID=330084 RepID=UPI000A6CA339|nr:sodium:solute symporter family protein [Amycolatopsis jejuensis]
MIQAIVVTIVLGTAFGAIMPARKGARSASFTEWAVGGRRFGNVLFWFLNAGESYSTAAVFGISGYAWAAGAPAYLAFTTLPAVYVAGYWIMPKIWRSGRRFGHVTQADFHAARYHAQWLGVVTGMVGIAALIVYVQIQLISVSMIVRLAVSDVAPDLAVVIAGVVMLAFVTVTGLRSAAFAATVKDILMVVVLVVLVVSVAGKVGATSLSDVFRTTGQEHPGWWQLPGGDPHSGMTAGWLITSSLSVGLGSWMVPQAFQYCYSAGTATTIRRTNVWMPLYGLSCFLVILLGAAALAAGTRPEGGDPNAALLTFVTASYPPWVVGLLAATGLLLALGPGSVTLLSAASTFARNVAQPLRPAMPDRGNLRVSRVALVVITAIAVWVTLHNSGSLVTVLLQANAALEMLAPAAFLGFLWRRTTAIGVLAGLVAGSVSLLTPFAAGFWKTHLPSVDAGLIALLINTGVVVLVSLVTSKPPPAAIEVGLGLTANDVPGPHPVAGPGR